MNRLRRTKRILGPVGWILALATAGLVYWKSASFWLGLFGFVMVSRFVIGCVPAIIHHLRRFSRTVFYLLWPAGGALILYLAYRRSGVMWFAVILGLVGGALFSSFVGVIFFRHINDEATQSAEEALDARAKLHAVSRAISRFGAENRR